MSSSAPRPHSRGTFAAIGMAFAAVASLQSLLIPVVGVIGDDLGADAVGVTWTLTAWLITAAVATPLLGRAGDLVGRRRMFMLALIAVAAGSVLAAFAPTLTVLILARVLQGLGGAIFPLGFGLVRDAFAAERVPATIGALSAVMAVGSGLGTVIAGPLSAIVGWRGLFALPLVLAAAALVLTMRGMPESATQPGVRVNVPAALLLSGWLVALLLPLSSGSQWGWGSPLVIGLLMLAAILAAAWVLVELRSHTPLVDMRMMRTPAVWTTNLTALLTGAGMFGIWAFLPRLAETPTSTGFGLGATVSAAGLIMLPMLVTMAAVGFVMGPLSRLLPFRALLVIGALVSAGASVSIALFHSDATQLAIAAAALGLGTGLTTSATPNIIVQSVPPEQTGIATGMNANVRTIGGALGTTLFSTIVASSGVGAGVGAGAGAVSGAGLPAESGYVAAFLAGGALAAAGAIAPLLARSRRSRPAARAIPVVESPLAEPAEVA
jgi:MFS family permease